MLEATKYLKLLQKNSPESLETHLLSFEVNMRKQKILLAFQVILSKMFLIDFCLLEELPVCFMVGRGWILISKISVTNNWSIGVPGICTCYFTIYNKVHSARNEISLLLVQSLWILEDN